SQFACFGDPNQRYVISNVCGNDSKQEIRNFRNVDTSYENHDDERNNRPGTFNRERRAVTDGLWTSCAGPCQVGEVMASNLSSAQLIDKMLTEALPTGEPQLQRFVLADTTLP